jgi:hypothetical protein
VGNTQPHRGRRYSGRRGRPSPVGARGPGGLESSPAGPSATAPMPAADARSMPRSTRANSSPQAAPTRRPANTPNGQPSAPRANGRYSAPPDAARRRSDPPYPNDRAVTPFEADAVARHERTRARSAPVSSSTSGAAPALTPPDRPATRLSDAQRPVPFMLRASFSAEPADHAEEAVDATSSPGADQVSGNDMASAAPSEGAAPSQVVRSITEGRGFRAARAERADRTEHQPLRAEARGDVGPLIDDLHDVFERDRAVASQGSIARCGICYLHFAHPDLIYREAEGFYVCPSCSRALGASQIFMVRRQQR